MSGIKNAYVFVADALRFDYLPSQISEMGQEVKCVASSTISPTSFSSIMSGLHPPNHSVWSFEHSLNDAQNQVLSVEDYSGSFWQRNPRGKVGDQAIFDVLGHKSPQNQLPISEITPPFILVERDATTHSPYGRYNKGQKVPNSSEYIRNLRNDKDLEREYKEAAKETASIFEERINTLKERDLLDETLIIFTSDHGELLGEYGQTSHGTPVVPELIYVPMVVLHPEDRQLKRSCIGHPDIIPTILDVIGKPVPSAIDGYSMFNKPRQSSFAYTEYTAPKNYTPIGRNEKSDFEYSVRGVFDNNGGWLLAESSLKDRFRASASGVYSSMERSPSRIYESLHHYIKKARKVGDPDIGKRSAQDYIKDIVMDSHNNSTNEFELSEGQKDRLENLGYK